MESPINIVICNSGKRVILHFYLLTYSRSCPLPQGPGIQQRWGALALCGTTLTPSLPCAFHQRQALECPWGNSKPEGTLD